ncbi:MAG: phosphodiester glycosidase family protein [Lachnospiraceae bacterium]|nr:phosphodiester glycosidase family protein [Lachnospiraceae bacterium]
MKRNWWPLIFTLILTAFTAYLALDTFVLRSTMQQNATDMNMDLFKTTASGEGASSPTLPGPGRKHNNPTETEKTQPQTSEETPETSLSASETLPPETSEAEPETSEVPPETTKTPAPSETETLPPETTEAPTAAPSDLPYTPVAETRTYQDENISIVLNTFYEYNTMIYAADVKLSSAQYLKTAFAHDTFGRNITQKTSEIAAAHGAIFAVNGDYYGAQETSYVVRNGIKYRDSIFWRDTLAIFPDGSMEIYYSPDITLDWLMSRGVWQVLTFGPRLIVDGVITADENTQVEREWASNPRTAIGVAENNHFIFVVTDGRTAESEGLSILQLAMVMSKLGAKTAFNLDGGGSSSMVFQGQVINKPTTYGDNAIRERGISDIVYIGY